MLSEKEGSEGLSAGSVGTLPRVTLGPVRELESLLICLLIWTCVLSTFLSSEYRVPGPDPFFRKTEATVPVLGMSSFSGENRKQMIKGYIVR